MPAKLFQVEFDEFAQTALAETLIHSLMEQTATRIVNNESRATIRWQMPADRALTLDDVEDLMAEAEAPLHSVFGDLYQQFVFMGLRGLVQRQGLSEDEEPADGSSHTETGWTEDGRSLFEENMRLLDSLEDHYGLSVFFQTLTRMFWVPGLLAETVELLGLDEVDATYRHLGEVAVKWLEQAKASAAADSRVQQLLDGSPAQMRRALTAGGAPGRVVEDESGSDVADNGVNPETDVDGADDQIEQLSYLTVLGFLFNLLEQGKFEAFLDVVHRVGFGSTPRATQELQNHYVASDVQGG